MTKANLLEAPDDAPEPFASAASMRVAHTTLLRRSQSSRGDDRYSGDSEGEELLAEVATFVRRGQATGVLLDSDEDRQDCQSILNYWTATLYQAGRTPPPAILAEFDPELAPVLDDSLCPYLGLSAFREQERAIFFGRSSLIQRLAARLRDERLLAVVGPSGSGKSSVVLAGLLPWLKGGGLPGSQDYQYYGPFVPGADPLAALAAITRPAGTDSAAWSDRHVPEFERRSDHLLELIQRASSTPAVVVVDQFEELFTLSDDAERRQAFVNNLLSLVHAPGCRHLVILTMRSEFDANIAKLPELQPLFNEGQELLTALGTSELREAIVKPAERVGLKFEDGLVDELVSQVLGEPAGLPLLQFTLLKLWENRDHNRVTWEAYRKLGGARQALSNSADTLFQSLIPQDQETAKRIFLRLVRPSTGLEVVNNRVRRSSLHPVGARDMVDRVIERLSHARLLRVTAGDTADDDQVEVAHEALIRNWPTLVGWLEEDREWLRQRLAFTAAFEWWKAHGRDPSGLLGGAKLEEARHFGDLNEREIEFLQASQAAAEIAAQEREAAGKLESELRYARVQVRLARRLRLLTWLFGTMTLLALCFAVYAIAQQSRARRNEQEAFKQKRSANQAAARERRERLQAVTDRIQAVWDRRRAMTAETLAKVRLDLVRTERDRANNEKQNAARREQEARDAQKKATRSEHEANIARGAAVRSLEDKKAAEQKLKNNHLSDEYQITAILDEAPIYEVANDNVNGDELSDWFVALVQADRSPDVVDAIGKLAASDRAAAYLNAAHALEGAGLSKPAHDFYTRALRSLGQVTGSGALAKVFEGLARGGRAAETAQLVPQSRPEVWAGALATAAQALLQSEKRSDAAIFAQASRKAAGQVTDADRQSAVLRQVIPILAKTGDTSGALDLARQLPPEDRSLALADVAAPLQSGAADRIWSEAVSAARQQPGGVARAAALAALAGRLAGAGRASQAIEIVSEVRQMSDATDRQVQRSITAAFARAGHIADALASAERQRALYGASPSGPPARPPATPGPRAAGATAGTPAQASSKAFESLFQRQRVADEIYSPILVGLSRANKRDDAIEAIKHVPDLDADEVFAISARQLARSRDTDDADVITRQISNLRTRDYPLSLLLDMLMQKRELDRARKVALDVAFDPSRADDTGLFGVLAQLAQELAETRRGDQALEIARKITEPHALSDALVAVARAGSPDPALSDAMRSQDAYVRSSVLAAVGEARARSSRYGEAFSTLNQAITAVDDVQVYNDRSHVLAEVAKGFAALTRFHRARTTCTSCYAKDRLGAYAAILREFTKRQSSGQPASRGFPAGTPHPETGRRAASARTRFRS